MRIQPLNVVLVEATNLRGRELRRLLDASPLPVNEIVLLGTEEQKGTLTDIGDTATVVNAVDEESFLGVDLAFFCGRSSLLKDHLAELQSHGALCVDMAASLADDTPGACMVVAGVNRPAKDARLLLNPHPTSIVLAPVLAALAPLKPVRADAVGLLPAAEAGQAGVEELHRQATALLNFSDPPREVFGHQLAFNLIPDARRSREREQRVSRELAQILGEGLPCPAVTLVWVPTFMGVSAVLHVELAEDVEPEAVDQALRASARLHLIEGEQGCGPAELDEDDTDRLNISVLGAAGKNLRLWCVTDHLRGGSVLNAMEVVETLLLS